MRTNPSTRSEADALLDVIAELAELRDPDALRRHTVTVLPALVESNLVAWNEVEFAGNTVHAVMEPDVYSREREAAFIANVAEHPVIAHYRATGDGRPLAISDFMSAAEFHRTRLYREFYRQLDAEDQMSFVVPDAQVLIGIALNRRRRGFHERDRRALNALRPHLIQAYRNADDFARLQRSNAALQAYVEAEGDGLLVLDRTRRRIEHRSPLAAELLQRWFGTTGLPEEIGAWLTASLAQRAPAQPLIVDRGERSLIVRRAPAPEAGAVLLTERLRQPADSGLRRLGLTAREAEVLVLVTDGSSVAGVAARLSISPRTVEKHVERAYDKLGVDNRVAATNLVRQLDVRP